MLRRRPGRAGGRWRRRRRWRRPRQGTGRRRCRASLLPHSEHVMRGRRQRRRSTDRRDSSGRGRDAAVKRGTGAGSMCEWLTRSARDQAHLPRHVELLQHVAVRPVRRHPPLRRRSVNNVHLGSWTEAGAAGHSRWEEVVEQPLLARRAAAAGSVGAGHEGTFWLSAYPRSHVTRLPRHKCQM